MSLIAYLRCDFKMSSGIAADRVWSGNSAMGINRLPADRVYKIEIELRRRISASFRGRVLWN